MRKQLPVWTIPFLLALVGITAFIGHLSAAVLIVIGVETLIVSAYLVILARGEPSGRQPTSNLLSLFPGHLLVLIMIAMLDQPNTLAWLWTLVPLTTLAYDAVGRSAAFSVVVRMSISMILYGIPVGRSVLPVGESRCPASADLGKWRDHDCSSFWVSRCTLHFVGCLSTSNRCQGVMK